MEQMPAAKTTDNNVESVLPSIEASLVFMGTPDFAVPSLEALHKAGYEIKAVVTQPDAPRGRKMKLSPPPVKEAALKLGLNVLQPNSLKDEEFAKTMEELNPDLIITAAYGRILPARILAIPKYSVNIHASLLPEYRGASPIQHVILDGRKKTGITIMLMDEGMDTGDILSQREMDIPIDMDAGQLTDSLSFLGADLLVETLPQLMAGKIRPRPQDQAKSTTIKPVTKEIGLIDWKDSVYNIHNKVRATIPWPCAYTFYEGERMKINRTALPKEIKNPEGLSEEFPKEPIPGKLHISLDKKRMWVECEDGFIEILELQKAGCKSLLSSQCAHNFTKSSVLGE